MTRSAHVTAAVATLAALLLVPTPGQAHSALLIPAAQMQLGEEGLQHQDWPDAAAHFREALALDSQNVRARVGLGYALLYGGDRARAAREFAAALKRLPHFCPANCGLHLTFTSDADRAAYLQTLEDRARQDPGSADTHAALAEELLAQGQTGRALAEAQAAQRLAPHLSCVSYVLGCVAQRRGDDVTAARLLQDAVRQDKNNADAWAALGDIAAQRRDGKTAADCYRRALTADAENPAWHDKLAQLLAAQGEAAAAAQENATGAHLAALITQAKSRAPLEMRGASGR